MALSQRERYLAIGVGVIGVLFVGQYGVNKVRNSINEQQLQVDSARSQVENIERTKVSGLLAAKKIEMLKPKSLPKNQEKLTAEYNNWLYDLGEQNGLTEIKIIPPERPSAKTDAYTAYEFKLSGICQTEKVVDLLADFYDKDVLHTLKSWKLQRLQDERDRVKIDITSLVMALDFADPKQELSEGSSGRLAMSREEYTQKIMNRNPFYIPNQAPTISTKRTHDIERGSRWSLDLEATDPEQQAVSFRLVSTKPDGLDFAGGRLSWKPEENGEYKVEIEAEDEGWPRQLTKETLVLRVIDPPKAEPVVEKPKFDEASVSFVSGITGDLTGKKAWIRNRMKGETLRLAEGEEFEVGTLKAKIISINMSENYVEMETDGRRWTVGMEMPLAKAYEQSQID
jgi:hypothetical protein